MFWFLLILTCIVAVCWVGAAFDKKTEMSDDCGGWDF